MPCQAILYQYDLTMHFKDNAYGIAATGCLSAIIQVLIGILILNVPLLKAKLQVKHYRADTGVSETESLLHESES